MNTPLTVHEFDAAGNRIVLAQTRSGATDVCPEQVFHHVAGLDYVGFPDLFAVMATGVAPFLHFWNRDGSKERVCGNALRCVGWLLARQNEPSVTIGTEHARFSVGHGDGRAWVDFPVEAILVRRVSASEWWVDCGTPHAVWTVADLNGRHVCQRAFERSTGMDAINVTLVARAPGDWRVRTFERGVGETGSCGTGAIAAFAALEQPGRTKSRAAFRFASGHSLVVSRERDGVRLAGTVNHVASRAAFLAEKRASYASELRLVTLPA